MDFRKILKPAFVRTSTALLREKGIKGFLREKGWKLLLGIIAFYLVRDVFLYLLIPFLIAQGFICGG